MSIHRSLVRAASGTLLLVAAVAACAQTGAPLSDLKGRSDARPRAVTPGPTPPASSPSTRLRRLDETGEANAPAGSIQQERAVVMPQVSLPLGRTPAAPTQTDARRLDSRRPAMRGGIDDAAARCVGQSDPQARAQCRDRVPMGTSRPVGVPR